MEMDYIVFIITGAPAVGKSTIAKKLRGFFPKGFFIDIDDFRRFVGKVDMNAHDEDYDQTLKIVAGTIKHVLQSGTFSPIFVFDCLTPKRIDNFIKQVGDSEIVKTVVLWMPNELLKERMTARTDHFYNDLDNTLRMNDWFLDYKKSQNNDLLFIDRGELDIDNTVSKIIAEIEKAKLEE